MCTRPDRLRLGLQKETPMKNDIIIFAFTSHCTQLVQMLDVSFLKSLKSHYKLVCKEWLDEECQDAKPYISKAVFLRLIHRAWINACQPQNFTNGWARMGLSACRTTGMVVINRTAIPDFAIVVSEKYSEERLQGSLQAVRVKGGLDTNGITTTNLISARMHLNSLRKLIHACMVCIWHHGVT